MIQFVLDPPSNHPHVFRSPQFLSNLPLMRVSTSMKFLPTMSWALGLLVYSFTISYLQFHMFLENALEAILPLVFFISSLGAFTLPLVFMLQILVTYFTRRPDVVSTADRLCRTYSTISEFASRQGQCYHLTSSCAYNGSNVDIVQLRRCRTCG